MLKTAVEENLDLVTEDCARVKVKSLMRIPIGISLLFSLLSFLNALYTLSGASVRWIDDLERVGASDTIIC